MGCFIKNKVDHSRSFSRSSSDAQQRLLQLKPLQFFRFRPFLTRKSLIIDMKKLKLQYDSIIFRKNLKKSHLNVKFCAFSESGVENRVFYLKNKYDLQITLKVHLEVIFKVIIRCATKNPTTLVPTMFLIKAFFLKLLEWFQTIWYTTYEFLVPVCGTFYKYSHGF